LGLFLLNILLLLEQAEQVPVAVVAAAQEVTETQLQVSCLVQTLLPSQNYNLQPKLIIQQQLGQAAQEVLEA
jgi:hypothetical protein